MPKNREAEKPKENRIDPTAADREDASPKELRDINEAQGDGGNPEWWRNESGKPGEVH